MKGQHRMQSGSYILSSYHLTQNLTLQTHCDIFTIEDCVFAEVRFTRGKDMCRLDAISFILGLIPYWKAYFNEHAHLNPRLNHTFSYLTL